MRTFRNNKLLIEGSKIMRRLKKVLQNPFIFFSYFGQKGAFKWMKDEQYLKLVYRGIFNKKLDLKKPLTYNEKLQWLKLYDRHANYTKLVDKYEVRNHIAKTIGEEYLIPLLGVWDGFKDIDFSVLPNQFVLKCTHDSGGIVICTDKSNFNITEAREKINQSLKRNFYYIGREWPYKNVKPRIICEQYMVDESGTELKDYKVFCFNGEPKLIQVDFNRFSGHKRNLYDIVWNYIPLSIGYPNDPRTIIKQPTKLREMLSLSTVLAKNYPHVRVDWYSIHNQLYFGELTFFHGSGYEKFSPETYNKLLGSWITIPKN